VRCGPYIPGLSRLFHLVPLSPRALQWLLVLVIASTLVFFCHRSTSSSLDDLTGVSSHRTYGIFSTASDRLNTGFLMGCLFVLSFANWPRFSFPPPYSHLLEPNGCTPSPLLCLPCPPPPLPTSRVPARQQHHGLGFPSNL